MRTGYEALSFSHDEDDHSLGMPLLLLLFTPVFACLLPSKWHRLLVFVCVAFFFVVRGYDAGWLLGASLLLVLCVVGVLVWGNAWYADQFLRYAAYFMIAALLCYYIDYLRHREKWRRLEEIQKLDQQFADISQAKKQQLKTFVQLTVVHDLSVETALRKVERWSSSLYQAPSRDYLKDLITIYTKTEQVKNQSSILPRV